MDWLPLNIRTFIETVTGNRSPITEKNLSKEELRTLRETIRKREAFNKDQETYLENQLLDRPGEYRRGSPHYALTPEGDTGKMVSRPMSYAEYQHVLNNELNTYKNTRGRTSFSYEDYPIKSGEQAAPVGQSWPSMLYQSFTDPAFRLSSTLGSAKAFDDGTSYTVKDHYGFDKEKDWYYNNASEKGLSSIFKQYWDRPGSLGEILYRRYLGEAGRPVEIKIKKDDK